MKSNLLKAGVLLFAVSSFLFTSCSENDDSQDVNDTSVELTAEDSRQAAIAQETSDGVYDIVESAYVEQEEEARNTSFFSDCVIITVSSENGITFVTLDFGLGCQLNNGNVLSGKINITYGPVQNGTRTINYSFENFTFNGKGVEGGATIFRERNNAAGNPQSTVNKDIVVSFPSGLTVDVSATREFEWIEGVGTGTWVDNAYLVTGNRTVNASTGFTQYGIITDALRREATCPFFVSGAVEISRNAGMGILDFGDGTCDNLATLTVNGNEHVIILN